MTCREVVQEFVDLLLKVPCKHCFQLRWCWKHCQCREAVAERVGFPHRHLIEVVAGGSGHSLSTRVSVDGLDISSCVRSVSLKFEAGNTARADFVLYPAHVKINVVAEVRAKVFELTTAGVAMSEAYGEKSQ